MFLPPFILFSFLKVQGCLENHLLPLCWPWILQHAYLFLVWVPLPELITKMILYKMEITLFINGFCTIKHENWLILNPMQNQINWFDLCSKIHLNFCNSSSTHTFSSKKSTCIDTFLGLVRILNCVFYVKIVCPVYPREKKKQKVFME